MLAFNLTHKLTAREKLLEKRIENLQDCIREMERRSSINATPRLNNGKTPSEKDKSAVLVLPVTYTPMDEQSPRLEIVSSSRMNRSTMPLILVEQSNNRHFETVV